MVTLKPFALYAEGIASKTDDFIYTLKVMRSIDGKLYSINSKNKRHIKCCLHGRHLHDHNPGVRYPIKIKDKK